MTLEEQIMKLQTYKMFEGEDTVYVERDDVLKLLEQEPCEDCISRQAVRHILNHEVKLPIKAWKKVFELVDNLPPVTPQPKIGRWIPVSERLPKAGEYIGAIAKYYLVQNEYGDMLVARYIHSEYWEQIYQLQPIGDKIVAWMPLPQPYTEGSGEE